MTQTPNILVEAPVRPELVAHRAVKVDFGYGIKGLSCSAGDWDNSLDTSLPFTDHLLDLTDKTKRPAALDDDGTDDAEDSDEAPDAELDVDGIVACDMRHTPPFDFVSCITHDTTFALGEACKFQGRAMWEVYAEEADDQRSRAVKVELALERLSPMDASERESFQTAYGAQAVQVAELKASFARVEALLGRSRCGWVEVSEVTAALAPPADVEAPADDEAVQAVRAEL